MVQSVQNHLKNKTKFFFGFNPFFLTILWANFIATYPRREVSQGDLGSGNLLQNALNPGLGAGKFAQNTESDFLNGSLELFMFVRLKISEVKI